MTLYAIIFYAIAALILVATGLAITRRNPVHAIVYLIISFFGSAMLFYLLGAPFLAALEVIIYAGAIMVLFLFVVMMLKVESIRIQGFSLREWVPAVCLVCIFLALATLLLVKDPGSGTTLKSAMAMPREFGRFLFERYWLAVEIVSLLLLLALVAAIQLGREKGRRSNK
jgi:NADH-quinone oxidoreductase subunit J